MSIFDGLIILVGLFFVYYGYQNGIIKQVVDLVVLFVSMIIASFLSKLLCGFLYPVLPFFNFSGNSKGLKSLNLIVWRLIVYFLIILIIVLIIKKVFTKLKITAKLKETILEAGLVSKILGGIIGILFGAMVMYNVLTLVNLPFINFDLTSESNVAKVILEKTPVTSLQNKDLYQSSKYARKQVFSSKNTDSNYENINNKIVINMVKNNLIDQEMVTKLEEKNKLLGKRKTIIDEIGEETGVTSPTEYNITTQSN